VFGDFVVSFVMEGKEERRVCIKVCVNSGQVQLVTILVVSKGNDKH